MVARVVAGRYEVQDVLGEGGMGVVYRAVDTRTDGLVAIKTVRDITDPRMLDLLKKEWGVLASINHPNIVQVRDVAEIDDSGKRKPCFIMPLLSGVTLAKLIRNDGQRLSVERVIGIVGQVCRGLQAAHDAGLVHRDIKPSNILIMPDDTAVLIDFGLVHVPDSLSVGFKGTWQYAAPEQIAGREPTKLSDIFSLGIVCYEALTGENPFLRLTKDGKVDTDKTAQAIQQFIPPAACERNHKASQLLSKAVHRALAKNPGNRYVTAREFGETLRKAGLNQPIEKFDPAQIKPRIERARGALGRDDYSLASDILTALEEEGNLEPEITHLRAQIREAVKQNRIRTLFQEARSRLDQDELALALEKLREILELEPDNPQALAMQRRVKQERDNQQIRQWLALARQHLQRHDFTEARQALREVQSIRYDEPDALQLLSEIDLREKEAARIRAENEQLYNSALKAYENGEISTALSKLEKIVEPSRDHAGLSAPDREAVFVTFYNQVRTERDAIESGYEQGTRYLRDKDFEKALELCNQMLASYPKALQFRTLKLQIEDAQRQELSAYIAEIGRSVDAEADLDQRVQILEGARARYPDETQFQKWLEWTCKRRDAVQEFLRKAREYEELGQFAEAVGQWKTLRSIHPQYPGLDAEIAQLESRRTQQIAEEKKASCVAQIDSAISNEAFDAALILSEEALSEFPEDPELMVLKKIARQAGERTREADALWQQAKKLQAEGQVKEATEILQRARNFDERNIGVRSALLNIYLERARSCVTEDWREAEKLAGAAAEIDVEHPGIKRIRTLVSEAERKERIDLHVSGARELQLNGELSGALARVTQALADFPAEPRLQQFRQNLEQLVHENRNRQEVSPVLHIATAAGATNGKGRADPVDRVQERSAPPRWFKSYDSESGRHARRTGEADVSDRDGLSEVLAGSLPGDSVPSYSKTITFPDKPAPVIKTPAGQQAGRGRARALGMNVREYLEPAQAKLRSYRKSAFAFLSGLVAELSAPSLRLSRKQKYVAVAIAGLAIFMVAAIPIVRRMSAGSTSKPASGESNARMQELEFSVTPSDAILTLNGTPQTGRKLRLGTSSEYTIGVSKLGYKPFTRTGTTTSFDDSKIVLEPEPLDIQVISESTHGTVSLDGGDIGRLKEGEAFDHQVTPDGNQHVLSARNESGDLFTLHFQAKPGEIPTFTALRDKEAKDVVVATSLGSKARLASATQPRSVSLAGSAHSLSADGVEVDLPKGEDESVLALSGMKEGLAVRHNNAPFLCAFLKSDPNLASITIKSSVQTATLLVDSKERKTRKPGVWRFSMSPGTHWVRLEAPGYTPEEMQIQAGKGEQIDRAVEMHVASASFIIQGGTPGAHVLINGDDLGAIDEQGNFHHDVPPGSATLALRKDEYEPMTSTWALSAGQSVVWKSLQATLRPFGGLTFSVMPRKAVVEYRLQGEEQWRPGTVSGSVRVKSGMYEVRATAESFVPEKKNYFVSAGKDTLVDLGLATPQAPPPPPQDTPSFFARRDELVKTGGWYLAKNPQLAFAPGKNRFTLVFLAADRMPPGAHKPKKFELVVEADTNAIVTYNLDSHGRQLIRKAIINGKETKQTRKASFASGDGTLAIKVAVEANRIVIQTRAGTAVDEFRDMPRDLSKSRVYLAGDAYFVVLPE